jgi:hypothetical protein
MRIASYVGQQLFIFHRTLADLSAYKCIFDFEIISGRKPKQIFLKVFSAVWHQRWVYFSFKDLYVT